MTLRLRETGALLGIEVVDHVIIGMAGIIQYYSFADYGNLPKICDPFSVRVVEDEPCKFDPVILKAADALREVRGKIALMNCLDLNNLGESDLAQEGYDCAIKSIDKEIAAVEDQLTLVLKGTPPKGC